MRVFARAFAVLALMALPSVATDFIAKEQDWLRFISSKTIKTTNWYTRGSYTNAYLGTYAGGEALILSAFDAKTFESDGGAVWACTYYYAIYPSNQNPATFAYADFKTLDGTFIADLGNGTQEWGRTTNITFSVPTLTNGDYTLALYGIHSNATGQVSDGLPLGETYNAFFTLIPEPASALVVGCALFIMRRRKQVSHGAIFTPNSLRLP